MSEPQLEQSKQDYQELLSLINNNMDIDKWGFVQTYSRVKANAFPVAIYDSESCRVKFTYEPRDQGYHVEREVSVKYGRLHAPNDGRCRNSRGKESTCWHFIWYFLDYLDGLLPQDVVDSAGRYKRLPQEFEEKHPDWKTWGNPRTVHAIKGLRLQNELWNQYGERLFDIFDLRKPELWEKYAQYHNEKKQIQYETWKAKGKIGMTSKQFDDLVPNNLW